jgi:hypothetical protein
MVVESLSAYSLQPSALTEQTYCATQLASAAERSASHYRVATKAATHLANPRSRIQAKQQPRVSAVGPG